MGISVEVDLIIENIVVVVGTLFNFLFTGHVVVEESSQQLKK
jgi:hypothetical protein